MDGTESFQAPDEFESGSFEDFAAGVEDQVKALLKQSSQAPKDAYEHFQGSNRIE